MHDGVFADVQLAMDKQRPSYVYTRTADIIRDVIEAQAKARPDVCRLEARRYVVVKLLFSNMQDIIEKYQRYGLKDYVERNFARIFTSIASCCEDYGNYENFLKDITYVSGEVIPCGAQSVAVRSKISIKRLLSVDALKAFSSPREWGTSVVAFGCEWFRCHTDSRNLGEFNEKGWDKSFKYIAGMSYS